MSGVAVGAMLRVLIGVAVAALTLAPALAAPVDDGVLFLTSTQEADGGWTSARVRRAQAVSEALLALQALGAAPAARTAAADLLGASPASDSDDRARRIAALAGEGRNVGALVAELIAAADPAGGWGLAPPATPDVLDTALALDVLATQAGVPGAVTLDGLIALLVPRGNDGGWACIQGEPSGLWCTSHALLALLRYRAQFVLDSEITAGLGFLAARLNPDGSFGSSIDDGIVETAAAALALVAAQATGPERLGVIQYLESRQQADGSWGGDPYVTALVLRALHGLRTVPVCGDDAVNRVAEACDGSDLAGESCESLGFGPGVLGCSSACAFDVGQCARCGDGTVNRPGEACDGTDLAGATCASLGFGAGALACAPRCTFESSGCAVPPACGDELVNHEREACDDADLAGQSCESLRLGSGMLGCTAGCRLDAAGCTATPACGDGVVNQSSERCDATDLGGLGCASFGGSGGPLACRPDCSGFDVGACQNVPDADGDGFPAGADCDDADPAVNPGQREIALNGKDDDCRPVTPDAITNCGVEVVFTMDTSASMNDEASALCSRISQVEGELAARGINAQTHLLGISTTRAGGFSCLTDHVARLLGPSVPGTDGCDGVLNQEESWGQSTAIVAARFPWAPDFIRVIVPISDEGPCNGDPCSSPGSDATSITNAGTIALQNGVFVSPIAGTGASTCTRNLATSIAAQTGGTAFFSTDPNLDLAGAIAGLLTTACEQTLAIALEPPLAVNPPGTSHAFTVRVTDSLGVSQPGRPVSFAVTQGPQSGQTGSATTGAAGTADFAYMSGGQRGVDRIVASVVDALGRRVDSPPALKFWDDDCDANAVADTCDLGCDGLESQCGVFAECGLSLDRDSDGVPDECSLAACAVDGDGDGFPACVDCDDADGSVNPGAAEQPANGVDDDCNPGTPDETDDASVACTLVTDRTSYDPHATAQLEGSVTNSDNGLTLVGLTARLRVLNGAGTQLHSETRALDPVAPGLRVPLVFPFGTAANPPGTYTAELQVSAGPDLLATCGASFGIDSTAGTGVGLRGMLAVEPSSVNAGEPSTASYTVENDGNARVDDLLVKLLVVDPESGQVLGEFTDPATLDPGAGFSASETLATAGLRPAVYLVILRVVVDGEEQTLDSATLTVVNEPLSCTQAAPSVGRLWPPNHKLVKVSVAGVTDPDGDPVSVTITSVLQDEPQNGPGDGNTCPDAGGVAGAAVDLRAERAGSGDGRVYHVRFEASDGRGGACTGEVTVCVPHSANAACVDQGALFDSTVCR